MQSWWKGLSLYNLYNLPRDNDWSCRKKYVTYGQLIKDRLSIVENIYLTTDIWEDTLNSRSYLDLTGHFIDNFTLQSLIIGVTPLNDRQTAENIKIWLKNLLEEWNISEKQVVIVVSDNAANISKAIFEIVFWLLCPLFEFSYCSLD